MTTVRCPDGHELRGTVEVIKGLAFATATVVDGTIEPAYEGETDVWWDSQESVTEDSQRLWECVEHDVFRERRLIIDHTEDHS